MPPRPAKACEQPVPEGLIAIRAPMLGIFYRAPAPGEKPFVEIGQRVKADNTMYLIKVIKLFNLIKAGADGRVVQILVERAALVEYNQVVILVEPTMKNSFYPIEGSGAVICLNPI